MKPVISFVTAVEQLNEIEECRPKPAKSYIPSWFKDIPHDLPYETVKVCPSFPDFFSMGYVLPMWCDLVIEYDENSGGANIQYSDPGFGGYPEIHDNKQFVDYAKPHVMGTRKDIVIKMTSPWSIISEKGWSVMQLPLFYHYDHQWSAMPGIIDTDIMHTLNLQVLYHGGQKTFIPRGTPLALYIPFRKEKIEYDVRAAKDEDIKKISLANFRILSKFPGLGEYRKMQREKKNER